MLLFGLRLPSFLVVSGASVLLFFLQPSTQGCRVKHPFRQNFFGAYDLFQMNLALSIWKGLRGTPLVPTFPVLGMGGCVGL